MNLNETLLQTPIYQSHLYLGAKMVPFGGWDMPVQYSTGIIEEYWQTRKSVAIFDISHMGEFLLDGDVIESGLDRIVTMNLVDLPIGQSRYGMMLNERGGVIDDLIVFRLAERQWMLVVNAATRQGDFEHLRKHLSLPDALCDVSFELGKIDIQGPLSREVMRQWIPEISRLDYFSFAHFNLLGENVLVSRTGYTGELGYEIFYPWSKTLSLWKTLLEDERVKPAGLGARDVLRLEVGYSLYGHELNQQTNPLESGLSRFLDFKKEFIGRSAVQEVDAAGVRRKIQGFVSADRRSPREGQTLFDGEGRTIGVVTSGSYSPALTKGIGLGFVESEFARKDVDIFFGDDKKKHPACTSGKIFYKNGSVKS